MNGFSLIVAVPEPLGDSMAQEKILIVDDEVVVAEDIRRQLRSLGYLVVGVVVVEVVFVYPGMGQYMVDAVTVRDMPVVQACGLIFAAFYIFLNMFADILAIIANPRLRHPR